jgi:hypothetical protein
MFWSSWLSGVSVVAERFRRRGTELMGNEKNWNVVAVD